MKKRSANKVNKAKRGVVRILTVLALISAIIVFVIITNTARVKTNAKPYSGEKYYKSIMVERGDSLWSIAEEYMPEEYGNIRSFVEEIKEINGIAGEKITYGANLIVPYFVN